MSESTESITADEEKLGVEPPKAIVHKQILDVAASRPEASIDAIAEEISGANATLVEHVLDEYGDPGESAGEGSEPNQSASPATTDPPASDTPTEESSQTTDDDPSREPHADESRGSDETPQDSAAVPDPEDLTEKQRETLQLIATNPDATQSDIASEFGVTSPTISQRVNAIEGFDWSDRHEFVHTMFETTDETAVSNEEEEAEPATEDHRDVQPATSPEFESTTKATSATGETGSDELEALTERIEELSDQVAAMQEDRSRVGEITERLDDLSDQLQTGTEEQLDTSTLREQLEAVGTQIQETRVDRDAVTERLDELSTRIESVGQQLEERSGHSTGTLSDPELAHKVVHACFESEQITEDEELQLLQTMLDD